MAHNLFFVSSKADKHERNQDSFGSWEKEGVRLFVLCDGMGGLAKGELASNTIVNDVEQWFFQRFDTLKISSHYLELEWGNLLVKVNSRILSYGIDHGFNIGSTVVIALLDKVGGLYLCHVGDSRAYGIDGVDLIQLTSDHTVVQRDLNSGRILSEDVDKHPQKHVLLQAIGTHEKFLPEFSYVAKAPHRILLCSDGFYNRADEHELVQWTQSLAYLEQGISMLRKRNESDDISALVFIGKVGDI